jgi:hypothetical protein
MYYCMGDIRNVYKMLVGKPEGKRPLGRPNVHERATRTWGGGFISFRIEFV